MTSARGLLVRVLLGSLGGVLLGCFQGEFLAGLPCESNEDCGLNLTCDNGSCSGTACGNGIVEALEQCDAAGESEQCDADCTRAQCGDGRVNMTRGEECDGSDLAGADCVLLGWYRGGLRCDDSCTFDTRGCSGCMQDAVCPPQAPVCDLLTHECTVEHTCKSDDDCDANDPRCDPDAERCVECLGDADCHWPTPLCDPADHECVECVDGGDCSGSTPLCAPADHECVECVYDGDCGESAPLCNLHDSECVECVKDEDCGWPIPLCFETYNTCVKCLADDDCLEPTPRCDRDAYMCVRCLTDDDCDDMRPACDPDVHICVGCVNDTYCASLNEEWVCNLSTQTCVPPVDPPG